MINKNSPGKMPNVSLSSLAKRLNVVALIVGNMVGTGVYLCPSLILAEMEHQATPFLSTLVVWVASGAISMCGALCLSAVTFSVERRHTPGWYVRRVFGDTCAAIYLWAIVAVMLPVGRAVMVKYCAVYALLAVYPEIKGTAELDSLAMYLAIALFVLSYCCRSQMGRTSDGVNNAVTFLKCSLLVCIIATRLFMASWAPDDNIKGHPVNMSEIVVMAADAPNNWTPSVPSIDVIKLSTALNPGIYAFSGWYGLNKLRDTMQSSYRHATLPMWMSGLLVQLLYMLMTLVVFISSHHDLQSVHSLTFEANNLVSRATYSVIAVTLFASLNMELFWHTRDILRELRSSYFQRIAAAARRVTTNNRLLLDVFEVSTTMLFILLTHDVYRLIKATVFTEALMFIVIATSLLWLKQYCPRMVETFKVHWMVPTSLVVVALYIIIMALTYYPMDILPAVFVIVLGWPLYKLGRAQPAPVQGRRPRHGRPLLQEEGHHNQRNHANQNGDHRDRSQHPNHLNADVNALRMDVNNMQRVMQQMQQMYEYINPDRVTPPSPGPVLDQTEVDESMRTQQATGNSPTNRRHRRRNRNRNNRVW